MCQLNVVITKKFASKELARNAYTIFKERVEDFQPVEISGEIIEEAEKQEPD